MPTIEFNLNGEQVTINNANPHRTLLNWIREEAGLTGTKEACNEGDCGACTIMLVENNNGSTLNQAVNSCIMLLPQVHGKSLFTVEGISFDNKLHPVQQAMVEHHGSQCGYCTPGIVMSLVTAHCNGDTNVDTILAGNLCRCTGYKPIVKAAQEAFKSELLVELQNSVQLPFPERHSVSTNEFFVPDNVDSFAEWYANHPDALLIAGATDVGLWVTKQLRRFDEICFISNLPGLCEIVHNEDELHVGAGVTLSQFHRDADQLSHSLAELIHRFGSVQVRNSATVGGNIANGSPIGDLAPALIALGSKLVLRKGSNRRIIVLEDFFMDYGVQDRQPGEFVESLRIPKKAKSLACYKLSKRFDQDISSVCGCFNINVQDGLVDSARIAFGGMAAIPKRATATEKQLLGARWNMELIDKTLSTIEEDFSPITDMRASRDYRLLAAKNLLVKYYIESTNADVQTDVYRYGSLQA